MHVLTDSSNKEDLIPKGIAKDMINKLPLYRYEGPVEVVSSPKDVARAVKILEKENLLGFDTESQPSFKRGVTHLPSLIQLAAKDIVFIFQLHLIGGMSLFAPLFESDQIIKAGVGINDDLVRLKKMESFNEAGFVEISRITDRLVISNKGLRGLAGYLLGVRISKNMQLSNWGQMELTHAQVVYAATDAWISREIYVKLNQ